MASIRGFFARLQWKLSAGYALFTFVLLLVAFLLLNLLANREMIYEGDFVGTLLTNDLTEMATAIQPLLTREALDEGALREILRTRIEASPSGVGTRDAFQIELTPTNVEGIAVFDQRGRVLAAYPAGWIETGSSARAGLPPEGDIAVNDALFGDFDRSGQRDTDTGHVFVGRSIGPGMDQVLGGLVVEYRPNLTDVFRRVSAAPGPLLPSIGFCLVAGLGFGFGASRWITRRLQRFMAAAAAWRRADFSIRIADASGDELGVLANDLNRTAEQLRDLLETRAELAALDERNRVARELHDSVKQQVFAASLQVAAVRELTNGAPPSARTALSQAETLLSEANRDLGRLIRELRPAELEDRGLVAALGTYTERWSRDSGIRGSVRVRGERPTPLRVEREVFRVIQEALTNVARHSGATRADVNLAWDARGLSVQIEDDGHGLADGESTGFGLENMRERMQSLDGTVRVESPGAGTRITAWCPVPPSDLPKGKDTER